MSFKLLYTATLAQTDRFGNLIGPSYTFQGNQFTGVTSPASSDLSGLASAMGTDISAQMIAGYPFEAADDGDNAATGGAG